VACSVGAALAGFGLGTMVSESVDRTVAPAPIESVEDSLARGRAADAARLQAAADFYLGANELPASADGAAGWLESEADAARRRVRGRARPSMIGARNSALLDIRIRTTRP
jgi:hypothetical protein